MGQKLNTGGSKQQPAAGVASPIPTVNSLVGSTSLFNYKLLMLDNTNHHVNIRNHHHSNKCAPNSLLKPSQQQQQQQLANYANRLSSLSTTVSTFSASTSTSASTSENQSMTTSSSLLGGKHRATSTPKMSSQTTTISIKNSDSTSVEASNVEICNRFSTASTMSSISTSSPHPRGASSDDAIMSDDRRVLVVQKPPQPHPQPQPLTKQPTSQRADRRATTSKRASFKEKLSRINKRWSVSRLNESTTTTNSNTCNNQSSEKVWNMFV